MLMLRDQLNLAECTQLVLFPVLLNNENTGLQASNNAYRERLKLKGLEAKIATACFFSVILHTGAVATNFTSANI